mgnify:CR=1 FL=1
MLGVDAALFVKALGAFFAVMTPFVALPMFLSLTSAHDHARQRGTGLRVVVYSLIMSIVVMASGSAILVFFGISVSHFRVAGGIVLMTIGLGMLNGGSPAHEGTASEKANMRTRALASSGSSTTASAGSPAGPATVPTSAPATAAASGSGAVDAHDARSDISFYPLTFPMILGPGTIASIIVFTGQADGVAGLSAVALALAAVLAVLFVVLWFAPVIGRRMSETLRVIMTRLMGMIVAAIAVAMVTGGLQELIPVLR